MKSRKEQIHEAVSREHYPGLKNWKLAIKWAEWADANPLHPLEQDQLKIAENIVALSKNFLDEKARNQDLQAKLAVAVEALEEYQKRDMFYFDVIFDEETNVNKIANDALAKIKGT